MKIAGIDFQPLMMSVAAKLAHMDADQQAAFLNTFFKELKHACGTHYDAERQLCYVRDDLTSDAKELAHLLTEVP